MKEIVALNVNVDAKVKEEATTILKELGLNMSTAINMFLVQIVKKDGIPFEIVNSKPNRKTRKALREADKIIKDIKSGKRKGYNNTKDLMESLIDN